MNKITVIDAICGCGKTSLAIDMMNSDRSRPWLFITPYIKEIEERIIPKCKGFKTPIEKAGTKSDSLKNLLADGENIACSHALAELFDDDITSLIKDYEYQVILDEQMPVIRNCSIKCDTLDDQIKVKNVTVENNVVTWTGSANYDGSKEVNELKENCLKAPVYLLLERGAKKSKMTYYVFEYPVNLFEAAYSFTILTFLFEGDIMSSYLKKNGIEYDTSNPFEDRQKEIIKEIGELIEFCGDGYYNIGKGKGAFNSTACDNYSKAKRDEIRKAIRTVFRDMDVAPKDRLVTTYVKCSGGPNKNKKTLMCKNTAAQFIPWTTRATNDYRNKAALAYLCNPNPSGDIATYFSKKGVKVNSDLFCLSNMIQLIFRLRIRNTYGDRSIKVFIPGERPRKLLQQFIAGEEIKY